MDRFSRIARKKIAELIKRDNFKEILSINDDSVYLDFSGDKGCKVDGFGKVQWIETVMGCTVDNFEGGDIGCVWDYGKPEDCDLSRSGVSKEDCKHWKKLTLYQTRKYT